MAADYNSNRVVTLLGGPMDGVVATSDAPCLDLGWYTHWPLNIRKKWKKGWYVLALDKQSASWQLFPR